MSNAPTAGSAERLAPEALVKKFYTAFSNKDGQTMSSCYLPTVKFTDPVFPSLSGDDAGLMWRMLTSRAKDLRIELNFCVAKDYAVTARWTAHYTFAKTGRPVINVISARFEIDPVTGLIARHVDNFDFWVWSRQALGFSGVVLGWSSFLQKKVQDEAARSLEAYRLVEKRKNAKAGKAEA